MMSSQLLVSILIPTFQQEEFIQACVDSVSNQKFDFDIEILVGDDCSMDRTSEIVQKLAQIDPRIHLYKWASNEGGLKNINKLLTRASGKYIAILEGDDYWLNLEHLAKSVQYLESHPDCIFTAANYLHLSEAGLNRLQKLNTKSNKVLRYWHLALGNFIQMGTIVYHRIYYPKIPEPYFGLSLGDYPLILSLLSKGAGVYLPHDAMAYRIHSAGVWSGQPSKIQAEKTIEVLSQLIKQEVDPLNKVLLSSYKSKLELQIDLRLNWKRLFGLGIYTALFCCRKIIIRFP